MSKRTNTYLILALIFTLSACQNSKNEQKTQIQETPDEYYDLKWKIDKKNPIAYKTAMEDIDEKKLAKNGIDCNDFFNAFSDTEDSHCEEMQHFFDAISNIYKNHSFTTTLTEDKNGAIDVKLIGLKNNKAPNKKSNPMSALFGNAMSGVQLRGKINKDGGIESFYIKKEQLNLLALMFELPTEPVKIGDRWSIQASFISNDQNFICDEYDKTHIVELIDVKEIDGEMIAFIKYDLRYYVNGAFNNPFFGTTVPTKMDVEFNGISEFNITKGKWKNYNALMSMDITGIMNNQTKQRFKLIEIEEFPKELLDIK